MTRLTNILSQSLRAVRAFKLRTFFCLISVAFGISAITVIVAATEGAYKKAFEIVGRFGPDSVLVYSGGDEARAIGARQKTLTLDDVEAVKQSFPSAYLVVPMTSRSGVTVVYKDKKYLTRVIGSTDDYSRVWTWPITQGSDFRPEDLKGLKSVGLIGQFLTKELFGEEDPVGKYILINGMPVQIIGVLSERGMSATGENLDDRIIMPISTVMKRIMNETKYITAFRVRFVDQENLYNRADELSAFLRHQHRLTEGQPDDFRIITPKEMTRLVMALTDSLVIFLSIVGVIALIVAGFVLANLFLLSVKERTNEIGIRRAAGAKKRDILFQFLGEAVIITSLGGVLGFLLGYLSSKLLVFIAEFPIHFSWKAFAAGLILSWIVGIGFGLQPARRAASLKPIEAIRS